MAEIHMGNDRELFGDTEPGLPLYEGRMVGQYDHRAKAYRSGRGRAAVWEELPFGHPSKDIVPQWQVPEQNIPSKLGSRHRRYRIGFNDIARPDTTRSLIAALVPPDVICGHGVPTIAFEPSYEWAYMPWLAVANSFCMDF
ncbi:MAG TPA: restriction endonuclease, partial [Actinomycetota bacterium]|nr:restriction endonuclease [Actinomycetota bacterium]